MNPKTRFPFLLAISTVAACSSVPGSESFAPEQPAGSTAGVAPGPGLRRLSGHVPSVASTTPVARHLDPATSMSLAIGLPLRDSEGLRAMAEQSSDPTSPSYRHYLTPDDVLARFAPTESDYAAVTGFARASGLTVTQTFPNRVVAYVTGAAGDVERALHVTLSVHRRPDGTEFFAPDAEPSVGEAVPVEHIAGLDNVGTVRRLGGGGSWSNGSFDSADLRKTYAGCDLTLTGAGQTLGLIEIGAFLPGDINSYASGQNITRVPTNVIPIGGGAGTTPDMETTGDIELANGMAPGLKQIDVFELASTQAAFDAAFEAVTTASPLPSVVSMSLWPTFIDSTLLSLIQIMGAQGQSFFISSGDAGSGNYPVENIPVSPGITLVGGTELTLSPAYGETAMNFMSNGQHFQSGGGIEFDSNYPDPIPSYQKWISMATNGGSTTHRNVPDVSMVADDIHIVFQGLTGYTFGGTSASAPLWAAFTALANQASQSNGVPPVGFANPVLYFSASSSYASLFNDVTSGTNGSYNAVKGYDLVTGLGTPKCALLQTLSTPSLFRCEGTTISARMGMAGTFAPGIAVNVVVPATILPGDSSVGYLAFSYQGKVVKTCHYSAAGAVEDCTADTTVVADHVVLQYGSDPNGISTATLRYSIGTGVSACTGN